MSLHFPVSNSGNDNSEKMNKPLTKISRHFRNATKPNFSSRLKVPYLKILLFLAFLALPANADDYLDNDSSLPANGCDDTSAKKICLTEGSSTYSCLTCEGIYDYDCDECTCVVSESAKIGFIVGGVVLGVLGLAIVVYFCCIREKRDETPEKKTLSFFASDRWGPANERITSIIKSAFCCNGRNSKVAWLRANS